MSLSRRIENVIKDEIKSALKEDADIKDLFDNAHSNAEHYYFKPQVDRLVQTLFDESKALKSFQAELINAINKARLNGDQTKHFFSKKIFLDIPEVRLFLDDLIFHIKKNKPLDINYSFYAKEMDDERMDTDQTDNILAYIKERYPETDAREQHDDKQVRRLDSLARLLSLYSRLSVCTAVAVHNGKLYISLNCDSSKVLSETAYNIFMRIEILNEFLTTIRTAGQSFFDSHQAELVEELYIRLNQLGGFLPSKEVIIQAIEKFTDGVLFDQHTFNRDIRDVFNEHLLNYRLLLPFLSGPNTIPGIIELDHYKITQTVVRETGENNKPKYRFNEESAPMRIIDVGTTQKCASIADIHAEQMIAYYIFKHEGTNHYSRENPLNIGVSKLCCKTCETNLEELPSIRTRGKHGVMYDSTASLINGEITSSHQSTPTKGQTDARRSPAHSAKKRRETELPTDHNRPIKRPRTETSQLTSSADTNTLFNVNVRRKLPFDDASDIPNNGSTPNGNKKK